MCVTVAAFAQDEATFAQAEHMTFKGIPMDCDISTFVSHMEAKGYTLKYPCDEYATTSQIPTHLIIVCTGSRFGDYFTGSTQSLLLVDDFELVY